MEISLKLIICGLFMPWISLNTTRSHKKFQGPFNKSRCMSRADVNSSTKILSLIGCVLIVCISCKIRVICDLKFSLLTTLEEITLTAKQFAICVPLMRTYSSSKMIVGYSSLDILISYTILAISSGSIVFSDVQINAGGSDQTSKPYTQVGGGFFY